MFIFPRRQLCYHLFGYERHTNRVIRAQSWDYLVYLRDLAVHKDHLPHHKKTLHPALEWWRHLLTVKLHEMFTWWHQRSLCKSVDSCTRTRRHCSFKRLITQNNQELTKVQFQSARHPIQIWQVRCNCKPAAAASSIGLFNCLIPWGDFSLFFLRGSLRRFQNEISCIGRKAQIVSSCIMRKKKYAVTTWSFCFSL